MGNYTKRGVPKAKMVKDLYRDPKYKGGACVVCRKRQRVHTHPEYPHMCDICRNSRVAIDDMPIATREVMSAQARVDAALLEQHLAKRKPESIQTLNTQLSPRDKIAAQAARFRALSVKK